jgi:hypothetical protein
LYGFQPTDAVNSIGSVVDAGEYYVPLAMSMTKAFTHRGVSRWPTRVGEAEAMDFWNRARGPVLLEQARATRECSGDRLAVMGVPRFSGEAVALPRAQTCFKSLRLPRYDSFQEMREILTNVLTHAIDAGMQE